MEDIPYCNILLKKKVKRTVLVKWIENNGFDFSLGSSTEAIQYYLYDFKKELLEFFNSTMNLKPESVDIEEIDSDYLIIIFETEPCYPSFHNSEKSDLVVIWESEAEIYTLNYSGFEIEFKIIK